jgi:hypothetical protein
MRIVTTLALLLSLTAACSSSTTTPTTTPAAPAAPAAPASTPPALSLEQGVDRPGEDYKDFDLDDARPEACRDACAQDATCKAFTFVKAGVQGDKARCWLKSTVPPAQPHDCCASGVRP